MQDQFNSQSLWGVRRSILPDTVADAEDSIPPFKIVAVC